MRLDRSLQLAQGFLVCCLMVSSSAQAQLVPDGTLGGDRSRVMPIDGKTDRIDGGSLRGVNLFHSFLEFNVGDGRGAYFANPVAVQNIFSRVTGSNLSKIDGTLGVLGQANLFLLNPNGIIFGPNARLDIAGSFFASTASGFKFADGSEYSATNPQAAPPLTVSIMTGLQRGGTAGAIANAGNLTVGRDLTLSGGTVTSTGLLAAPQGQVAVEATVGDARVRDVTAQTATLYANNNLILEESQLYTTGNLSLLAENTVRVRDSVANPFLAQAGGNLYIQGNQGIDILALNHPQTPFVSGGNLSLVSDGNISGDAHFTSGKNFSILNLLGQPANFISRYDPIISSDGDVTFGNYTGAALKVQAAGNIVTGDITINAPDVNFANAAAPNFPNEPSDEYFLGNFQALILRAGFPGTIDNVAFQSIPGTSRLRYTEPTSTPNANFDRTPTTLPGNITVNGSISTTSSSRNAGPIILSALNGSITIGSSSRDTIINAAATGQTNNGNGGNITIEAPNGEIKIERSVIYNNTGDAPKLGFDDSGLFGVERNTGGSGGSGRITIRASSVNVSNSRLDVNAYGNGENGNGNGRVGNILIEAINEGTVNLFGSQVLASNYAGTDRGLPTENSITIKGGTIKLAQRTEPANNPAVDNYFYPASIVDSTVHRGGRSGGISIQASGMVTLSGGYVASQKYRSKIYGSAVTTAVRTGAIAPGGDILIKSDNNEVNISGASRISAETAGDLAGNAGNVTIQANNSIISISGFNSLVSTTATASDILPGNISLTARTVSIKDCAAVKSDSQSNKHGFTDFGKISILSTGTNEKDGVFLDNQAGVTAKLTNKDARGWAGDIYIDARKNIEITNSSGVSTDGDTGRILIGQGFAGSNLNPAPENLVPENVLIKDSQVTSRNNVISGERPSGEIKILASKRISVGKIIGEISSASDQSNVSAKTSGIGNAGEIELKAPFIDVGRRVNIDTLTTSSGIAGDIKITANNLVQIAGTVSTSSKVGATETGRGGTITVQSTNGNSDRLKIFDGGTLSAETNSAADGGNIEIKANKVEVNDRGRISTTSSSGGIAGNISIKNAEKVVLSGKPGSLPDQGMKTGLLAEAISPIDNGIAGNVTIDARKLTVENGAQLTASNISAKPLDSEEFGNIVLRGLDTLEVTSNGRITASTVSGRAGSLTLNKEGVAVNSVTLTKGALSLSAGNEGIAGGIWLNTRQLTLQQTSTISAAATGTGEAGSLSVNANGNPTDFVKLSENSSIKLTSEAGVAGNIDINTRELKLESSEIAASTQTKQAGNLTITNADLVQLDGGSSLAVRATDVGTAGNLTIHTNTLTLNGQPGAVTDVDKAQISVSSPKGQAGNLDITAKKVTLNGGILSAKTGKNSDNPDPDNLGAKLSTGNIQLHELNLLFLQNESLLSATANGNATGGNVTIDIAKGFIFGFYPTGSKGSDISANASQGNGGKVTIDRTAIFGLEYRLKPTPLNDITASSESGLQGTVTFRGIDVDPTRGISPLPTVPVDPSNKINTNCTPNSNRAESRFVNVGRGGLPSSPGDPLSPSATLPRLATIDPQNASTDRVVRSLPKSDPPTEIIEAQSWTKLPNGRIRLVTQPSSNAPSTSWQNVRACNGQ